MELKTEVQSTGAHALFNLGIMYLTGRNGSIGAVEATLLFRKT